MYNFSRYFQSKDYDYLKGIFHPEEEKKNILFHLL